MSQHICIKVHNAPAVIKTDSNRSALFTEFKFALDLSDGKICKYKLKVQVLSLHIIFTYNNGCIACVQSSYTIKWNRVYYTTGSELYTAASHK